MATFRSRRRRLLLCGLAIPSVGLPGRRASAQNASPWRDPEQHFFQTFLGDLPAELEAAGKAGKKGLLIVYEMEGCPHCTWLHRMALREVSVQQYYRQHFAALKIDVRGSTSLAGFDKQNLTESAFAVQQKVRGTPTCVFYDLQGREVVRFTGAPRDKQEFMLLGEYVADGHFNRSGFPEYRRLKTGS